MFVGFVHVNARVIMSFKSLEASSSSSSSREPQAAQATCNSPASYRFGLTSKAVLVLVLAAALVFSAMRVVGALGGASWQFLLPLGFVLMTALAWVLYTSAGRQKLGFASCSGIAALRWFVVGMLASAVCYGVGMLAFGATEQHWYVSIGQNFVGNLPASAVNSLPLWALALMFILPAALFSPIGEEVFFRGVLQHTLEQHVPQPVATWVECGWFALVHLCHHGLVLTAVGSDVRLLGMSALAWVLLMLSVARLFVHAKRQTGSIYIAMACHCGFNVGMGLCIFLLMWPLTR